MFVCYKCGACCRNLHLSEIYADLNRGDGVCKYLQGNLCSIYDKRPLVCRIDDAYDEWFSDILTREQYYQLNYDGCKLLRGEKD